MKDKSSSPEVDNAVPSDSFYVYSRIFPSKYKPMLWLFVALIGIVLLIVPVIDDFNIWEVYAGITLIGLAVLRFLLQQLMKQLTYKTYRDFRRSLPFQLEGWDRLGQKRDFFKALYWSFNCSIEINVNDGAGQGDILKLKEYLFQFNTAANKHFYESWMSDGRNKWEFNYILKVSGSANTSVVGDMYTLVNKNLRSFNETTPIIKNVIIIIGDRMGEVKPPPTD